MNMIDNKHRLYISYLSSVKEEESIQYLKEQDIYARAIPVTSLLCKINDDIVKNIGSHSQNIEEETKAYFQSAAFILKSLLPRVEKLVDIDKENAQFLIRYINCIEYLRNIDIDYFPLRIVFYELSKLYNDVIKDRKARKFSKWSSTKEFYSIPDIIRGNIETFCQHYSTTFGWQPFIQNSENNKNSYCPLYIAKDDKEQYFTSHTAQGKEQNIEKVTRDGQELDKLTTDTRDGQELDKLMTDDNFGICCVIDKKEDGTQIAIDKENALKYLAELLSPERFLEATDKILYKPFKYIYQIGDTDIKDYVYSIISCFREKEYDQTQFKEILLKIIMVLHKFTTLYDKEVRFENCYDEEKISLLDVIHNRAWEWLYHFKFRLDIYEYVLDVDSKKTAKECLEKAYQKIKHDANAKIPSDAIKGDWSKLIKILKETKKLSDTPKHILSKTVKFFPNSEKFDDFCKKYRITLDIRGILLGNNEALTTKSKLEYEGVYNEEIKKILPTDEDIKNEIEGRKEQSRKLLEEKKEDCFEIPRYNRIFSDKDSDKLKSYLDKLGFKETENENNEKDIDVYSSKNSTSYIKLSRKINHERDIEDIARDICLQPSDIDNIKLLILSILTMFEEKVLES